MRLNMPITETVHYLTDRTTLITTTDLRGHITSVNADFVAISGYCEDELLGTQHHIVRHPHMPPSTFDQMWHNLKSGVSWNGLVKNRCKNGDCFWIDLFVAPFSERGEVIGYQSVGTRPNAERIARAEMMYQQMSNGQLSLAPSQRT